MHLPPATSFVPHGQFRPRVLRAMVQKRWFIRLRWAFAGAIVVLLSLEQWLVPDTARPWQLWACAAALAAVNAVWFVAGRAILGPHEQDVDALQRYAKRAAWSANLQMIVDLILLTLILRYSGGVENPMAVFYLFHTLLAALLLRPANALLQGCWALLLFGGLAICEFMGWFGRHYAFLPYVSESARYADPEFVTVTLAVLAAAIFGTLYFTLQVSARLDEQEEELRGTFLELRESREAIRRLQARRSRFMETAAHQLKSPLAGVRTMVSLIHDEVAPPEQVRPLCRRVMRRCDEGIQQVGELLALARIQQCDPTEKPKGTVDVGRTVEEVCRRYAPIAKDKGLALECGIESRDDLRVQVDPAELADCVANLVDNAIKYTPPPGRVTVRAARGLPARMLDARSRHGLPPGTAGEWVSIAVADTGMGLDPETLDALRNDSADGTIFDAYRRANNALEAGIPGTGLGLTIVREVAERCGGKIIVHSERGAGSTFTIALPVSPHDPTTSARLPPGSIVLVSGPDEDSGRSDACVAR